MATEQRAATRHGWVRCPGCGQQFLHKHVCRKPLGEPVTRRPEGFEEQVAQAERDARAARAAGEQLTLTDMADPCRSCGLADVRVGDAGDCVSCMAAAARAAAMTDDDEDDPNLDALAAVIDAETEALRLHEAGDCHLSQWSCSYCEAAEDALDRGPP